MTLPVAPELCTCGHKREEHKTEVNKLGNKRALACRFCECKWFDKSRRCPYCNHEVCINKDNYHVMLLEKDR